MRKLILRRALVVLLCLLLLPTNKAAEADSLQTTANQIEAGIIAVAVGIGVVVVILVVHYKPASAKGCVSSGPNGLELANLGNKLTYDLAGDTSSVKPGELVKVKGKKKHSKGSVKSTFTVSQLSKDFGPCPAAVKP